MLHCRFTSEQTWHSVENGLVKKLASISLAKAGETFLLTFLGNPIQDNSAAWIAFATLLSSI